MKTQKLKKLLSTDRIKKYQLNVKIKYAQLEKIDISALLTKKTEEIARRIAASFPPARDFVKKNEFFFQASGILIITILSIDCLLMTVQLDKLSARAANTSRNAVDYTGMMIEKALISRALAADENNAPTVQNFNPSSAMAEGVRQGDNLLTEKDESKVRARTVQARKAAPVRQRSCKNNDSPQHSDTKGKHVDEDCCPDPDEWPKPGCVYTAEDYSIMLKGPIPANKLKKK